MTQKIAADFHRIELLGIIAAEADEACLVLDDEGGRLVFADNAFVIDCARWVEIRDDWRRGSHYGDCVRLACSCSACYWAAVIETGNRIALALEAEKRGMRGRSLAVALNEGEEPPDGCVYIGDLEDRFRAEIVKAGIAETA